MIPVTTVRIPAPVIVAHPAQRAAQIVEPAEDHIATIGRHAATVQIHANAVELILRAARLAPVEAAIRHAAIDALLQKADPLARAGGGAAPECVAVPARAAVAAPILRLLGRKRCATDRGKRQRAAQGDHLHILLLRLHRF
ncbi:hypothetical protein MGWOODY_Smn1049 [hydrothermal vent metagenome]|uniref:Uncharacterized protein n=1 Tax=hydrothermal vent metagenome TaxID=652676 RepID=A0A160TKN9_9ZZZZ